MHGDKLALQMGGKLGDFETRFADRAEDFVAVGLALGGALQVEEARVPRGNLDADEAEAGGPVSHAAQSVEWCFVAGELREENSWSFDGFHCYSPNGSSMFPTHFTRKP